MPLARVVSGTCVGLEAIAVDIEVDVGKSSDKSVLVIVGLPDTAVREAKDRVLAAVRNSGHDISSLACTVNLAPADIRKEGAAFDLPIAIGLLCGLGAVKKEHFSKMLIVGELGLGGHARPITGALAYAYLAKKMGCRAIILPQENGQEASLVPGIQVVGVASLQEAVQFLLTQQLPPVSPASHNSVQKTAPIAIDFADVYGQIVAKRALEIAAAGGHNVLLQGPPGTGKSMLAKALVSILPEMDIEEALEVTKIFSISGKLGVQKALITERPFRSPHHTISYAGLIGGGSIPRPGEIVLAHRGVLFLDELPEFSRNVLEALRQPLEDGTITLSRALGASTYPCSCLFVAAMNPCPCGYLGHPDRPCRDSKLQIERYQKKISGPLLDRIDLHVHVGPVSASEIEKGERSEGSHIIRARVGSARQCQKRRFQTVRTNAEMSNKEVAMYVSLDAASKQLLDIAIKSFSLSMRAVFRLLKVARTIADLAGEEAVVQEHLLEALSFRQQSIAIESSFESSHETVASRQK